MTIKPLISIVEDTPEMRLTLTSIVESENREVVSYANAEEALGKLDPSRPGCWIVDNQLPGMQGIDFLQQVTSRSHGQPAILVSGHADVSMTVEAMQAGALTVLEKPCDPAKLNAVIDQAIELEQQRVASYLKLHDTTVKFQTLTSRELSVLKRLLDGSPNKRIASDLDIGLRTVELRRATIMKKMGVTSLAELVRVVLTVWPDSDPDSPPDDASSAIRQFAQSV